MDFDGYEDEQPPPPSLPKLDLKIDQLDDLSIKLKLKEIILTGETYKFDISTDIKKLMRNGDSLIALFAVRAVSEMARNRSHRVLYTDQDSMRPIFRMLEYEMSPDNILIFKHCCRALGNMCCENNEARKTFVFFDGVKKIKILIQRLLNSYSPQIEQMIAFPVKVLLNFTLGGQAMAKAVQEADYNEIFEKLLLLEAQKENMNIDTISSIVAILNAIMDCSIRHFFPPSLSKAILVVLRESKNVNLTELCLEFLISQVDCEPVRTMIMENNGVHLLCDRINVWLERSGIGQCEDPYQGDYLGAEELIDDSDEERSVTPPVNEQPEQVNFVNGNLELPIQNMEIDGSNEIQNAEISQNPDTPDNGEATPRSIEEEDEPPPRRNGSDGSDAEASQSVTQSGDAVPNTRRVDDDDDNMENNEALAVELVDDLPTTTTTRRSRRRRAPILSDEDSVNGDNNEAIPVQLLDSESDEDEVIMQENNDQQSSASEESNSPSPEPSVEPPEFSPEEVTKRKACDLIIMTLVGDAALRILFQEGRGEAYKTMVRWIHSEDVSMVATAALTIANFARDEYHCVLLMDSGMYEMLFYYFQKYFDLHLAQRENPEGFPDFDEMCMIKAEHALLSAMRNLCVPIANKPKIVNDGKSVQYFIDAVPNVFDYHVAFKLLAVLRMLAVGYLPLSHQLVSNETSMRSIARWGRGRDHNGPAGEAPRLLAVIIKQMENDHDMLAKIVNIEGCVSSLVGMILNSHYMMQAEAMYGLSTLAKCLVNTQPPQEPIKSAEVEEKFLSQLVAAEIGKHLVVLLERCIPRLTIELLGFVDTLLSLTISHRDMCEEYKTANLNDAIEALLTAKPNLDIALKNGLRASANTIAAFQGDQN